ncbi:MAG TPA: hypothetical protein VFF31_27915 [Blastocatellia bacterium]|nr:hypothetical protein [Blastocatellia bacterium]
MQNPILKVLSSIKARRVRALLMGGQACVFYGAAEFSRDTDLAILATSTNLERLTKALEDLQAEVIAVPPFEPQYLRKGHAVHFRCNHPEATGMRVDVMTKMRGVDSFTTLWGRRTTISIDETRQFDLMSIPDLVKAKKTQRDKDWPMVRRLVEVNYFENREHPTVQQIRFWFLELRTPELLIELSARYLRIPQSLIRKRPLLKFIRQGNETMLTEALRAEERSEREADREYWLPLKAELERLRHARATKIPG